MRKILLSLMFLFILHGCAWAGVKKIMGVGDSVSIGYHYAGAYYAKLDQLLGSGTYTFVGSQTTGGYHAEAYSSITATLLHTGGFGGSRSLPNSLTAEMSDCTTECFVFILAGVNGGASDVVTLVNDVDSFNSNITVFVLNYPGQTSLNNTIHSDITTRQATKSNLYWVDLEPAIQANANWQNDYYTGDGPSFIHPVQAGYEIYAQVIYDQMQLVIDPTTKKHSLLSGANLNNAVLR